MDARLSYSAKWTIRAFFRGSTATDASERASGSRARFLKRVPWRVGTTTPPDDGTTNKGFLAVLGLVSGETGFFAVLTRGKGCSGSGSGMSKSGKSSSSLGSDDCERKVGF